MSNGAVASRSELLEKLNKAWLDITKTTKVAAKVLALSKEVPDPAPSFLRALSALEDTAMSTDTLLDDINFTLKYKKLRGCSGERSDGICVRQTSVDKLRRLMWISNFSARFAAFAAALPRCRPATTYATTCFWATQSSNVAHPRYWIDCLKCENLVSLLNSLELVLTISFDIRNSIHRAARLATPFSPSRPLPSIVAPSPTSNAACARPPGGEAIDAKSVTTLLQQATRALLDLVAATKTMKVLLPGKA